MRQWGNKESRDITVQPWGKVLVPHQGIHKISSSCFEDTEAPARWEKLRVNNGMLNTSTWTPGQMEPEG